MIAVQDAVKTIDVSIQGLPPGFLMASKRIMEAKVPGSGTKTGVHRSPEEEAELHAHWTTVGKKKMLAIPWVNLYRSICSGAADFKSGRKSMTNLVAATISCTVDMISIGTDQYEVYPEWVRIPPRTGAMVKIGRPRIREWEASFVMVVDPEMYGKDGVAVLKQIIAQAGKMVGIGPWRPQLKGPYGRFVVTKFEVN